MDISAPSRVRILFEDGVCEEVKVSFVGECRCRLEETPLASSTEARLGDVVVFEPAEGIAKMRCIAERSPFEMLTWSANRDLMSSPTLALLVEKIESDGGRVERAFGGTLLVHVRADERENVERAFAVLCGT